MQIDALATMMTGVGIAVGAAHQLGASKLVMYSSILNGLVGAYGAKLVGGAIITEAGVLLSGPGDPMGAFIGYCYRGRNRKVYIWKNKIRHFINTGNNYRLGMFCSL